MGSLCMLAAVACSSVLQAGQNKPAQNHVEWVKKTKYPSYGPVAKPILTLTLYPSGKYQVHSDELLKNFGTLDSASIQATLKPLEVLSPDTKLIDLNPDEPELPDAERMSLEVKFRNQEKPVLFWEYRSLHQFKPNNLQPEALKNIQALFEKLSF